MNVSCILRHCLVSILNKSFGKDLCEVSVCMLLSRGCPCSRYVLSSMGTASASCVL